MSVGPEKLEQILMAFISNQFPLLITGAPGVGKSDIVAQAATRAKAHLLISHPVVSDPTDYKGMPFVSTVGEADFLPFGDLKALIRATEPTIFFLDDLGQAPPAVQAAAMQLLLARQINGKKIADCVTFVAATNRREDKAGVTAILEPVKSRFVTIVELVPNVDDWITWAYKNKMPEPIIGFVRFKSNILTEFKPTAEMKNTPCPRTIANAGKIIGIPGMDFHVRMECLAGAAGEGFATEYSAFAKSREKMPDPDKVIAEPDTAPVDFEASTMHALCTALAYRATKKTIGNIIQYADRIPVEYGVLTVRDSIRKDDKLASCTEFVKWAVKHQKVFLGK